MGSRYASCAALFTFVVAFARDGNAFVHVVRPGETLAHIAERVYGDASRENVLVGANALDVQGGTTITPGMHLVVPAPMHHTVARGETWTDLAATWLGTNDPARAELLASANRGYPWVPPVEGQEIEIPAVFTYIAGDGETVDAIAGRFWGDPLLGWVLNRYNARRGMVVARGQIVLVPMSHLHLTDAGRAEARASAERDGASDRMTLEHQRAAESELPGLLADVRYGRYAEAIADGNRLLGRGGLTRPQLATVQRSLVEAYVAVDATAAAAASCAAWKSNTSNPTLDPVHVSPKIRAACSEQ